MKRISIVIVFVFVCCLAFPLCANAADTLIPVGKVVGLQIGNDRVVVAGFDSILGASAQKAGLQAGDQILTVGGDPVRCPQDITNALSGCPGKVEVEVLRDGKTKHLTLLPQVTEEGAKLGIYLKQGITGIGTITWYDPNTGRFGALGHGVNAPGGKLAHMESGNVYQASVTSVVKGRAGNPGQLMGRLESPQPIGKVLKNTEQGIFGETDRGWEGQELAVADSRQIQLGAARILCNVTDDQVQEYSVEILKIYPTSRGGGRNMLLKITDPALLEITGGIVQGMSGSPIIQNGKLVGAVTHVLVNDPTTGYGIFIENMLDAAA